MSLFISPGSKSIKKIDSLLLVVLFKKLDTLRTEKGFFLKMELMGGCFESLLGMVFHLELDMCDIRPYSLLDKWLLSMIQSCWLEFLSC